MHAFRPIQFIRSPAAGVRYCEYAPHPALAQQVRAFWSFELAAEVSAYTHPILPDGCIDIVEFWQEAIANALLVGAMRLPQSITLSGPVTMFGVRFWPGGLQGLTGFPLDRLTDEQVALEDLIEAWPELASVGSVAERLACIEQYLLRRLGDMNSASLICAVTHAVRAPGFHGDTCKLARELGVSLRTLERRCLAAAGVGPKTLARVFRFERAAALLQASDASLAQIAMELAYADQAHFSREFRCLAGISPGSYRAQCEAVAFLQDVGAILGRK